MSAQELQDLKANLITLISASDDEEGLGLLSKYANGFLDLNPRSTGKLRLGQIEAIRKGERQIENGETATLEEVKAAFESALRKGLSN